MKRFAFSNNVLYNNMLSAVCFVSLQKVNKKSANDNVLSRLNTFFQKESRVNGLDTLFHQRVLYLLREV